MGKKRSRKAYSSKGERYSISRESVNLVRRDAKEIDRALNTIRAWRAGKNPWVTVPGTSTRERFVRVRANDIYGNPKKISYSIYKDKADE